MWSTYDANRILNKWKSIMGLKQINLINELAMSESDLRIHMKIMIVVLISKFQAA